MHVSIIGGGITGLVIGYNLSHQGFKIDLFEREDELGGLAGPARISGGFVEKAYHLTFKGDLNTLELIERVGLQDRFHWRQAKLGILHQGRIHDFSGVGDLLRFTPLSLLGRLRMGALVFYLSKIRDWKTLDSKAFAPWARRIGGDQVYEAMWEPLLEKKFQERKEQVPVAWMWGKTHRRANSRSNFRQEEFGYIEGSFRTLYNRLAEEIVQQGGEVHRGVPVTGVHFSGERVEGIEHAGGSLDTDVLVSAVPYPLFWNLVRGAKDRVKKKLPAIPRLEYLGAICLIVSLKQSLTDILWLNVNDPDIPFVVAIEISNLIGRAQFGGNSVIYLASYLPNDSKMFGAAPESIFETYSRSLKKIFPHYETSLVTEYRVEKHPFADPIPSLNYSQRLPPLKTSIENLYLSDFTRVYPYDKGSDKSIEIAHRISSLISS